MRISGWLYGIQQCLSTCCILLALGACSGARSPAWPRLIFASLAGGLISTAAAVSNSLWCRLLTLALTLLLPQLAWPRLPHALYRRMIIPCFCLPLALAGTARFFHSLGLSGLWFAPLLCLTMPLLARLIPRSEGTSCITVEIICGVNRIRLTALVDSGNLLHDPLTRLPIIVVSRRTAARLISLPPPGEITPGMRLMSVRTVSGTGLMAIFRPDSVRLLLPGGWRETSAMVGVSPGGYEGFQALVPAGLTCTNVSTSQGG